MRRQVGLVLSLVLLASAASFAADETTTPEKDTRRHVKVLQNPYDISSFYTSSQSSPFAGYAMDEDVTDPYSISSYYTQDAPDGRYPISSFYRQDTPTDRYPIAGFYRQGARGRYSRFWTVSPRRGVVATAPGRLRRRIATRELCLLAPTVLVPFAPFVSDVR